MEAMKTKRTKAPTATPYTQTFSFPSVRKVGQLHDGGASGLPDERLNLVLCVLTGPVRLQVPGPPGSSRQDGGGRGRVDRTDGLNLTLLVLPGGDLQNGGGGTLAQLSRVQKHLCESLLACASAVLQGAAQVRDYAPACAARLRHWSMKSRRCQ